MPGGCGAIFAELCAGGAKSARALKAISYSHAVCTCAVRFTRCPVAWLTRGEILSTLLGTKKASKQQVEEVVVARCPGLNLPKAAVEREHIVDAASVLLAASKVSETWRLLVGMMGNG